MTPRYPRWGRGDDGAPGLRLRNFGGAGQATVEGMPVAQMEPKNEVDANALYSKISWRLIPYIFFLYTLCYLDRVNLGFAAVEFKRDLHLSNAVYGTGAAIFFLGQLMFDLPQQSAAEQGGGRGFGLRAS